jgi:hypothetical protein
MNWVFGTTVMFSTRTSSGVGLMQIGWVIVKLDTLTPATFFESGKDKKTPTSISVTVHDQNSDLTGENPVFHRRLYALQVLQITSELFKEHVIRCHSFYINRHTRPSMLCVLLVTCETQCGQFERI